MTRDGMGWGGEFFRILYLCYRELIVIFHTKVYVKLFRI